MITIHESGRSLKRFSHVYSALLFYFILFLLSKMIARYKVVCAFGDLINFQGKLLLELLLHSSEKRSTLKEKNLLPSGVYSFL